MPQETLVVMEYGLAARRILVLNPVQRSRHRYPHRRQRGRSLRLVINSHLNRKLVTRSNLDLHNRNRVICRSLDTLPLLSNRRLVMLPRQVWLPLPLLEL